MTSPLSCAVLVDGVRLADGSTGEDPAEPFALSGLSVTWGRSTSLDQPAPASCSLTVREPVGGASFRGRLATGRRLDVVTHTTIYPDPTIPIVTDPSFENGGPGWAARNATVAVVGAAGAKYALAQPVDAGKAMRLVFPPAPFVPDGTNPAAWDAVPRTLPGQVWRYGARVSLPAYLAVSAAAQVHPVAFTGPWSSHGTVLADALTVPNTGAWQTVAGDVTPAAGVWLGVCVDVFPTGPRWADVGPAITWGDVPPGVTWAQLAQTGVDDLLVLAPAAGADRLAVVFGGRITDIEAERDADGTLITVIAQDHTAELANRDVGDQPWPTEPLSTRAQRIITLAGQATNLTVDAGVASLPVSLMDVDKQPSTTLLAELATSADAVLWSAVHATTGQYLRIEDTGARPPLMVLAKDPADGLVKIVPDPAAVGSVPISACDVLLDPVRWVQDVADVSTRVQVRWLEQTTQDGAPATVEHTETAEYPDLIAQLGVRRVGVSTVLTTQAAGLALAERVLARTADVGWRIAGLVWSTGLEPLDPDAVTRALTLLDGTTRLGCPIVLTDLPEWAPAGPTAALFLEGGTYTFDAGAWSLDMVVSAATGQGGSVQWGQLDPSWRWQDIDPTIRWADLRGVAGPHATTERD